MGKPFLLLLSTALLGATAQAMANEVPVRFSCTVANVRAIDCNVLRARFFKEKSLPFIREADRRTPRLEVVDVSVGKVPAVNGSQYVITFRQGNSNSLRKELFVSDGLGSASALQLVNAELHQGILAFAKPTDEATVDGSKATMTYAAPGDEETPPAAAREGRWVLKPTAGGNYSKYSGTPATYRLNGGARFDYSGDRSRLTATADATFNGQSVPVTTGSTTQSVGVTTQAGSASVSFVRSLDPGSHINYAVAYGVQSTPLYNIDLKMKTSVGVEYNFFPFLTSKNPNSLAIGLRAEGAQYHFSRENILDKNTYSTLSEVAVITGSMLLDKKRGTVVSASLSESLALTNPRFYSIDFSLSGRIRLTDRISFEPSGYVSYGSQGIFTASEKSLRDISTLPANEAAYETVFQQAQAAAASSFAIGGTANLTVTLGDGTTRVSEDQRGSANR